MNTLYYHSFNFVCIISNNTIKGQIRNFSRHSWKREKNIYTSFDEQYLSHFHLFCIKYVGVSASERALLKDQKAFNISWKPWRQMLCKYSTSSIQFFLCIEKELYSMDLDRFIFQSIFQRYSSGNVNWTKISNSFFALLIWIIRSI